MLCDAGVLREPLLYMSLFFKEYRERYYELLDLVRHHGDWEAWLSFFLQGMAQTADAAVDTAHRLLARFDGDRSKIEEQAQIVGSVLRCHEVLKKEPISSQSRLAQASGLTVPTIARALEVLEQLGIAEEITGKQRNRRYAYRAVLSILEEGTEALP